MGKKSSNGLGYLFLAGMALTIIGFCCPMIKGLFGSSANGFKFINFDNSTFVTIGAMMIFCGACLGAVIALLPLIGIKVPNTRTLGIIALAISIIGGLVLFIGFQDNGIYKAVGKHMLKNAMYGFYMVIAGWVVSLCGWILKI